MEKKRLIIKERSKIIKPHKPPKKKKPSQKRPEINIKKDHRAWGLASRLEHRRVKGKNRKRPGKEK